MTKVLTQIEEVECFKKYKELDDRKAFETLVECNQGMINKIAQKFTGQGVPYEDLVSTGNISLIKTIEYFDYTKGFKFSTYAFKAIERGMLRLLQVEHKHDGVLSLSAGFGGNNNKEGEDTTLEDIVGMDDTMIDDVVDSFKSEALKNALRSLTSKEREVILFRYADQKTRDETGKALGVTGERIRQIEEKALIKMRHPRNTRKLKDFIN